MGDLTIRILEARNLIPADRNGKSDPYATIEIVEDPMQKKQKTHCHHKTLNPVWQETFNFRAPANNSTILIKVWDRDLFTRNDPLGNVSINVGRLQPNAPNNLWLDLLGVPSGQIHVDIKYVPFVQAGGPQPTPYGQQYPQQTRPAPQQTIRAPQQNPPQIQNNTPFPQQAAQSSFPPSTTWRPANPTNPPTNSVYPQQGTYNPAPTASNNPTASLNPPNPTSSYVSSGSDDGDVGTDYASIAANFNMNTSTPPAPYPAQQYPQQPQYPQQQPYPQQQTQPYPPQQSYPPQQQPYPQQPYASQQPYPQQPYPQQPYPQQPYASQQPYPQQPYPQQQVYQTPAPSYPTQAPPPQYPPQQSYPQQGYPPNPSSQQVNYDKGMPMLTAQGLVTGPSLTKFFVHVKKRLNRDYIVIMDMSGSMSGRKWEQAKLATMKIAPFACQADPDGITLYLFNSHFTRHNNLISAQQVQAIFSRAKPSSTTDLAGVLRAAFTEHFTGNKPTTILVITDGEPDSQAATTREIIQAANRVNSQEDLSVSFIQIGDDADAARFLKYLDDNLKPLGARFDIVDTLSADELGTMSFDQLIEKSIYD